MILHERCEAPRCDMRPAFVGLVKAAFRGIWRARVEVCACHAGQFPEVYDYAPDRGRLTDATRGES